MVKEIQVIKMNGDRAPYDESKLRRSLNNAGADKSTIDNIISKVDKILHDGIQTKELFRFVFKELRNYETTEKASSHYNLKKAMIDLRLHGGFVFEKFIAKLLTKQGYKTELNRIIRGNHISHEIDVSAKKEKEILMVEVKHHAKPWLGSSIQTALYVYARFLDLKKHFNKAMLVTNTKFSHQVIEYSKGVNLKLMGWNYPHGDSLESNIKKYSLYPITAMNIKRNLVKRCLEHGIITVDDFKSIDASELSKKLRIDETTSSKLIEDGCKLCESDK
jgi:Holliday junction resolvase-like predicted endonuclease